MSQLETLAKYFYVVVCGIYNGLQQYEIRCHSGVHRIMIFIIRGICRIFQKTSVWIPSQIHVSKVIGNPVNCNISLYVILISVPYLTNTELSLH